MLAIARNTLVKAGATVVAGGRLFALTLTPSIVAMLAALWGGCCVIQETLGEVQACLQHPLGKTT